MADTSDVQAALAALVADVLYPSGASGIGGYGNAGLAYGAAGSYGNPTVLGVSTAGMPVRIYRGWPVAQQLDPDLAAGIAHVTIFPRMGMGKVGLGNLDRDQTIPGPPPTVIVTVAGSVVTLTGTATPGNLVGLLVDGVPVVYQVQPGDTLASIAAALVRLLGGNGNGFFTEGGAPVVNDLGSLLTLSDAASAALIPGGVALTIGTTRPIIARTGSMGQSRRRPRQTIETMMLTCWAPSVVARDTICRLTDGALSDIRWLPMADQQARLQWAGTRTDDVPSKSALWRRDISYLVTYWTTITRAVPPMMFGDLTVAANGGPSAATFS